MRDRFRAMTIFARGLLILLVTSTGSARSFEFEIPSGPYPVGLRFTQQVDASRVYGYRTDDSGRSSPIKRFRPLQIIVWYPAESSDEARMSVNDYLMLSSSEPTFQRSESPLAEQDWIAAMTPALHSRLRAIHDAKWA